MYTQYFLHAVISKNRTVPLRDTYIYIYSRATFLFTFFQRSNYLRRNGIHDDIRLLEGWRCTWPRLFAGYRFCFRVSSLSHPAHYEACTRNRRQGAGCKRLEFHCSRQADRLETGGKSETFRRASPCRTTVKKHFEFASESGLIEKSQLYPARRTGWGVGGWGKKWKEFLETVNRFCETFRETTCETLGI